MLAPLLFSLAPQPPPVFHSRSATDPMAWILLRSFSHVCRLQARHFAICFQIMEPQKSFCAAMVVHGSRLGTTGLDQLCPTQITY